MDNTNNEFWGCEENVQKSLERNQKKLAKNMEFSLGNNIALQSIAISLLRIANSLEKLEQKTSDDLK